MFDGPEICAGCRLAIDWVTDKLSKKRRSENMRRIKSKGTKPEIAVRRLVHGMGYRYRLHYPKLPGRPDLAFPAKKKIIEVHGCFWHQHRGCVDSHVPKSNATYWRAKLARNQTRDRQKRAKWKRLGWVSLVVWECESRETSALSERLRLFLDS